MRFGELVGKEASYLAAFYAAVIQAPIIEEALFRGIIVGGLLACRSKYQAAIWSAILFAIYHMNPWQFPVALILGTCIRVVDHSNGVFVALSFGTRIEQFFGDYIVTVRNTGLCGKSRCFDLSAVVGGCVCDTIGCDWVVVVLSGGEARRNSVRVEAGVESEGHLFGKRRYEREQH